MYVPRVGPLDEVERELCERARGVCVLCCLRLSSRLRECSLSRAGWFPCSCLEKDLSTCKFGTQTYKHHLSRLSRSVVTAPATANVLRRSFGSVRARAACVWRCVGARGVGCARRVGQCRLIMPRETPLERVLAVRQRQERSTRLAAARARTSRRRLPCRTCCTRTAERRPADGGAEIDRYERDRHTTGRGGGAERPADGGVDGVSPTGLLDTRVDGRSASDRPTPATDESSPSHDMT